MRLPAIALDSVSRPAHRRQMLVLLLAALLAALAGDWFRQEERLLLPKPLPVFHVSPPAR